MSSAFNTKTTLLEYQLEQHAIDQGINAIYVMENQNGYYIQVEILKQTKTPNSELSELSTKTISTRRDRRTPRIFKTLEGIDIFLKKNCPSIDFQIIRHKK